MNSKTDWVNEFIPQTSTGVHLPNKLQKAPQLDPGKMKVDKSNNHCIYTHRNSSVDVPTQAYSITSISEFEFCLILGDLFALPL